jgi:hypothetical protein
MATVVPIKQAGSDPLAKEMALLVLRAETDRNRHIGRIHDCYKFALPWRHLANQNQPNVSQIDEIFDETIGLTLEDFAADMLNTFTPQKNNWIEFEPVNSLARDDRRQVEDQIKRLQTFIFAEMSRSNLYQALQEAYLDLGPGTMCLLIQDIDPSGPIHCEAIPATDLLLLRGPFGKIKGIFRKKRYLREDIKALWPQADMTPLGPEQQEPSCQDYEVTDGCWRRWEDRGNETYQYAVECAGKIIYAREWKGKGSCPFIAARWSRDSTTAWGVGPTYRTLPATRTANHVRYLDLKTYDKHVDPVISYEDDGVLNIDQGVESGLWIPRAPGSKAPETIESRAHIDVQMFERDELRSVIRRAHYQDRPEQLGKTPPTATQWADERAERARRMGTPATNLVEELQYPIVRRFMYLLAERGVLPKVMLQDLPLDMQPSSPLLRAQEQEEVIRLDRFAEMIGTRFGPQMALVVIKVVKYAHRLADLLGIDRGLLNDETTIQKAIEQLMPILQNFAGSGVGGELAAPPAPGPGAGV